jgi:hypothetical protein
MTLACDALAFVCAGNGMEFAARHFMLNAVEMGCNGVYSCRVPHKDDTVSQVFGFQVKVETRAVLIDNQF